jgi:L-cystine transport system ATP-binding protein
MIVAKQIVKTAKDGASLLSSTDVVLQTGTITAVVGPNGSGKSTLLRCLSLIDPPDSGSITVGEAEYKFPRREPLVPNPWPAIGAVFQGLHLWPHLTIRRNILLASRESPDEMKQLFKELIAEFNLSPILDRYPSEVSGGERQRCAIARALMPRPRYLFLDEPTSATDVEHSDALAARLCSMARGGTTILLVTHMLGLARKVSDYLLFMEDGAVLARGGPDLLTGANNPRVARFVSIA